MNTTPEPRLDVRPIALGLASIAIVIGLARLLPESAKITNLSVVGALALFAGARLRGWQSWAFPFGLLIATDTALYFAYDYPPFDPFTYLSYAVYVGLAAGTLRKTESPWKIGGVLLLSSTVFFLLTNLGAWIMKADVAYDNTFATLLLSYEKAIPFHRNFLIGDAIIGTALFGSFAVLTRLANSPERIREVTA